MATRDYLIELGCEELPAIPLYKATKQFGDLVRDGLDAAGLAHGGVRSMSTPRRITVIVSDLAEATEAESLSLRGPAAAIAFDADGNPTKAAQGFARGKGADASELVVREDEGREYVFLEIEKPARPATEIITEVVSASIPKLSWPRSQRWGRGHETFGRPLRWIVSLFGDEIVPVHFAGVEAGRTTRGLRVLHVEPAIADVASYESVLEDAGVIVDTDRRRQLILDGIKKIEDENGLRAETPAKIFDEVVNLVEWPQVLMGAFDEEFLQVPHEIICESMLSNQRYFPLYNAQSGELTRNFILVANTPLDVVDTVVDGNERVVRARLYDAKFFYDEDLKVSLEEFRSRLARVGFQEKLGTVLQKSERIERLSSAICEVAGLDAETSADAIRAAHFAKADLVSGAVIEFTSQQGVMGAYYAKAAGEHEDVAIAMSDHYRPRFAGDELPRNIAGCVVAVADKLDTIAGMFAIDEPPTGSKDPFALRRSAIGILNILREKLHIGYEELVPVALEAYAEQGIEFDAGAVCASVCAFIKGRLEQMARDEKIDADTVAAVSAGSVSAPVDYFALAHALKDARDSDADTFDNLATAYARASHLADADLGVDVDASLLGDAERELLQASDAAQAAVDAAFSAKDFTAVIAALAGLRAPVDRFFDEVLVMDQDEALRTNRLRLLNRFEAVFSDVANIGELARKK